MAQQTINVGTSPNDGTGTPLRTAFQYTNSNFSELYTATGPSGNNIVVPGTATITGDLTVDTSTLKVDSTNNRVGIGTVTPAAPLHIQAPGTDSAAIRLAAAGGRTYDINSTAAGYGSANNLIIYDITGSAERWRLDATGNHFWNNVGGVAGTAMTLNSTGLGVGDAPAANSRLTIGSTNATGFQYALRTTGITTGRSQIYLNNTSGDLIAGIEGSSGGSSITGSAAYSAFIGTFTNNPFYLVANSAIRATIDSSGNVGIGVAPSAWGASFKPVQIGSGTVSSAFVGQTNSPVARIMTNSYFDGTNFVKVQNNTAGMYAVSNNVHEWYNATTGTGNFTFTQAMTLDSSGNLLVGTTSGTYHTFRKNVAADAGNQVFEIQGTGGGTSSIYYSVSGYNANAANSAAKFGRDATTLRSINAGGTVNASGADYAEYMVKCSDFILSKGDVAGIDANGKLTNVFADAVSFVVKSTDPSYVGNDKWGVDLEGDALEAARQLVDRIAFAGQVPVNVTGAKAGDYIVPVVNGTGIKGQAVSNPTFEQYQLAVGKVISIDADGRARIIVKVA